MERLTYLLIAGGLGLLGFCIHPVAGIGGLLFGGWMAWTINRDRRATGNSPPNTATSTDPWWYWGSGGGDSGGGDGGGGWFSGDWGDGGCDGGGGDGGGGGD
jgi:hypothetical protein